MEKPSWESYSLGLHRIKVDGGHIYEADDNLCFVPEIDLMRYQSHLRDAYTKGYRDGQEDTKNGLLKAEHASG